jgi:O-antigen ligase
MRKDQKSGVKILLVSVIIIIILLSLFFGIDSILRRFSVDNLYRESRLDIWSHTWGIFADYPVFGSGLGTFGLLYPAMEADGELIKTSHAHNDYMEYLSELGIVGMILLIGGIFYIFITCLLKWRKNRHPRVKSLGLGGIVAVLSLLVHGLADFNFQIPSNILLFSVVLSLTFITVTHPPSKDR